MEGISIGSGAVESTVKQIAARIKIAGAQWKSDNIPQVLRQRCAYLNGEFSTAELGYIPSVNLFRATTLTQPIDNVFRS